MSEHKYKSRLQSYCGAFLPRASLEQALVRSLSCAVISLGSVETDEHVSSSFSRMTSSSFAALSHVNCQKKALQRGQSRATNHKGYVSNGRLLYYYASK